MKRTRKATLLEMARQSEAAAADVRRFMGTGPDDHPNSRAYAETAARFYDENARAYRAEAEKAE